MEDNFMSNLKKLLEQVDGINSEEERIKGNMDTVLNSLPIDVESELTGEVVAYLNDKFDGDFSVVSSVFDDKQYNLTVQFSPDLPTDVDTTTMKDELGDIFGCEATDVNVLSGGIEVNNIFNQETIGEEEEVHENHLEEAGTFKKVVRDGKVVKKLICPPGMKALDGKCVKMGAKEIMARKKAALKSGAKRHGKPMKAGALKSRALSMKKHTW